MLIKGGLTVITFGIKLPGRCGRPQTSPTGAADVISRYLYPFSHRRRLFRPDAWSRPGIHPVHHASPPDLQLVRGRGVHRARLVRNGELASPFTSDQVVKLTRQDWCSRHPCRCHAHHRLAGCHHHRAHRDVELCRSYHAVGPYRQDRGGRPGAEGYLRYSYRVSPMYAESSSR